MGVGLCVAQYEFHVWYPSDGFGHGTRWYSKAGCEREIAKFKARPHPKDAQPYCEERWNLYREKEIS